MLGPGLYDLLSGDYHKQRRSSEANDQMIKNKINHQMDIQFNRRPSSPEGSPSRKPNCKISTPSLARYYRLKYYGGQTLDKYYTLPMLPWIMAEIKLINSSSSSLSSLDLTSTQISNNNEGEKKTIKSAQNVIIELTDNSFKMMTLDHKYLIMNHELQNITKLNQDLLDRRWFYYLYKESPQSSQTQIHAFQAQDGNIVLDLFTNMRDLARELINGQTWHAGMMQGQRSWCSSGLDFLLTNSHQFEVMYIGFVKMFHKRVSTDAIDDAVKKFKKFEEEKEKTRKEKEEKEKLINYENSIIKKPDQLTIENELKNPKFGKIEIKVSPTRRFIVQQVIEEGNEKGSPSPSPVPSSEPPSFMLKVDKINDESKGTSKENEIKENSKQKLDISDLNNTNSLIPNTQSLDVESRMRLSKQIMDWKKQDSTEGKNDIDEMDYQKERKRSISGEVASSSTASLHKQISLSRTGSIEFGPASKQSAGNNYKNKTLLFLIGRFELCLLSTDNRKILSRSFNQISHCSQGYLNREYFGLIWREPASAGHKDCYVIHLFKCQTDKLVQEIMSALRQAFSNAHQARINRPKYICDFCPMERFHRFCCDVEGLSQDKANVLIMSRIEALNQNDRDELLSRFNQSVRKGLSKDEQNELLMIYLKQLFELKQKKHSHQSPSHEKGLLEKRMDTFKEKAKSSLNTFENLFKKVHDGYRERAQSLDSSYVVIRNSQINRKTVKFDLNRTESSESVKSIQSLHSPITTSRSSLFDDSASAGSISFEEDVQPRQRSNTLSEINPIKNDSDSNQDKCNLRSESLSVYQNKKNTHQKLQQTKSGPLIGIFNKVGGQKSTTTNQDEGSSWRHTIFGRIASSPSKDKKDNQTTQVEMNTIVKKKTKSDYKNLWISAIKQTILLNKMEKENKLLQDNQNVALDKRMKLDYDEIPCFDNEEKLLDANKSWDNLIKYHRHDLVVDKKHLKQILSLGVPRHKRGDVWLFLAKQYKITEGKSNINFFDDKIEDAPYRALLGNLTTQQHAILVDLGRTFPKIPYFAQPLGPGQLALFNLLKAYSLLDTEVEYCQGLSFVAGILLLHLNEDDSFEMMKHLLISRELRKQYKPEMDGLQIQLYQLTRLIYDLNPEIFNHFNDNDVSATLYAAPWFLTLFASQFPIGFVARLFAIFRVALTLIQFHAESLLQCGSFESLIEYLKTNLPSITNKQMELLFDQVLDMDIGSNLQTYQIEYRIISEEMHYINNKSQHGDGISLVKKKKFKDSNQHDHEHDDLHEQIQVYQSKIKHLETMNETYLSTIKQLERKITKIEDEKDALIYQLKTK